MKGGVYDRFLVPCVNICVLSVSNIVATAEVGAYLALTKGAGFVSLVLSAVTVEVFLLSSLCISLC